MREIFSPEELERDKQKADKVEEKKGLKIKNPMARFNMNLDVVNGRRVNPDWEPKAENIRGKSLEPAPDPRPSSELLKELESPEKITDPETGQKFNVLKLNWEKESKQKPSVLVFLPPYNNAVEKGATHYRIQQLAQYMEGPVLAIDHPQMGNSDPLTDGQKKALATEQGYSLIADAELRIMHQLGVEEIDLVGQSMGAWAVASIAARAAEHGIEVRNAIIVETPGIIEMNPGELARKEMSEGKYLDLSQSRPYDDHMRIASGQHHPPLRKGINFARWALSTITNDPGGVYAKSMAKASVERNLREALNSNKDLNVSIVYGSMSQVSPREANVALVQSLDKDFPCRVHQTVFPGEPHTVMENAKRFSAQVKLILTGSPF